MSHFISVELNSQRFDIMNFSSAKYLVITNKYRHDTVANVIVKDFCMVRNAKVSPHPVTNCSRDSHIAKPVCRFPTQAAKASVNLMIRTTLAHLQYRMRWSDMGQTASHRFVYTPCYVALLSSAPLQQLYIGTAFETLKIQILQSRK